MAIRLNSLGPVTVAVKTVQSNQAHAASSDKSPQILSTSASAKGSPRAAAVDFRFIVSRGLAAAGAASANARAAATAADASATTISSTATTLVRSVTPSSAPAATSDPKTVRTAEQVFGASPWVTNPTGTGPNGLVFGYNPIYFATASTAADVAGMVGGTVVEDSEFTKNTPSDPFAQQQPNEMVELPDGALINPGVIASFYTHGYQQSEVNQDIANEVAGAEASLTSTAA
jgi:hypothetical protein